MGRVGEQPQGEVLFDYQAGPEATGERDSGLGADIRRHRPRAPARGTPPMIPRGLARYCARAWRTLRRDSGDPGFHAEIEEHVRLLAERYRRQGVPPEAGTLAARRQFGNTALLQEDRRAL